MANPDMDQPQRRRDRQTNDLPEERTPGSSESIRGVGDEDEFEDVEEIDDEDTEEDIER